MVEDGSYDSRPNSSMHYCKVCQKGFTCGEALGGHMRSHALVLDAHAHAHARNHNNNNYEDSSSFSLEDKLPDANNKHSYFLRTTANRFLSCKAREACHKMSLTWPEPDDHNENGKCTMNEMVSPISWHFKYEENDESCASSQEEEELANCLVMLSNSTPIVISTNKDQQQEDKLAHMHVERSKGVFQCKGCKKVFNSHQALGGHRASHKNVKGCFASSFDHDDGMMMINNSTEEGMINTTNDYFLSPSHNNNNNNLYNNYSEAAWGKKEGPVQEAARRAPWDTHQLKKKAKVHECSICYRTFPTGQALGGHKRCHWLSSSNVPAEKPVVDEQQLLVKKKAMIQKAEEVDLNFSLMSNNNVAAHDDEALAQRSAYLPKEEDEDEGSRNNKVEKLSDLRDMKLDGESSTWLQMGIASTT